MEYSSVSSYELPRIPLKKDDYVMRVSLDNATSKFKIDFIEETREFAIKIFNPLFENMVLRKSLRNLWKAYSYNQEYISFLLRTSTKEEFLRKAEEFAQCFEVIDKDQLYFGANLLLSVLDQPLSSADLSLFFNIDPDAFHNDDCPLIEYDSEDSGSN